MKNQVLYRIFTEATGDKAAQAINLAASAFPGFTILQAAGYWQGVREASLIIEIQTDSTRDNDVRHLAWRIKETNDQEAVLVQTLQLSAELI